MRGLTVRQPWAEAIACRLKDVENRTWPAPFFGPVAIHAGLLVDMAASRSHLIVSSLIRPGPRGVIVAVAEVVGCHYAGDREARCAYRGSPACSPWAEPDRWHWQLAGVRRLAEPVLCRGALGLWSVPADRLQIVEGLL